jgi:hypothetical protein
VAIADEDEEAPAADAFLVLNAIYLRKLASLDHIAQVTALDAERARSLLAAAQADGSTIDLGGAVMLSDSGRERVLRYYRDTYAGARNGPVLQGWYARFETINTQFIKLVTEWQQSGGDERVQERLIKLVERNVGALRELAQTIPRYDRYAARFENGLTRIDSGETDFVCKPTIDSVHNVWFEFHEDILAVLGQPRET